MDKAVAEYPTFPATFGMEAISLSTFNKSGVFGDPTPSTAAKGEALISRIVDESVKLVELFLSGR
ncbi:hypothetical protein [Rhizobium sp. RCAM05973]|nr:hypothetical protein [Rhizobium sp. RCAM05973]